MKVNPKQLQAVLALSGPKRYEHFVKVIADSQQVWGLYQNGWALAATDDGRTVFPMWPAREYAEASAQKEWAGYEPRSFTLDELMQDLLPKLRRDGVLPGVFYTPASKGVTPSIDVLTKDIEEELEKY